MEKKLSDCKVAIFGLGLMGGSLAMALQGKCQGLIGVDPDSETLELARTRRIVQRAFLRPAGWFSEIDLAVLAAPVLRNLDLLEEIKTHHSGNLMVLDLGSTKAQIVRAMAALPAQFDPLGGHPMCGKELGGLDNADPRIYSGATFALTPLTRSTARVRDIADQLVHAVGAIPIWLDAEIHDRWVASTSHLPYLAANAIAAITPEEAHPLVGPGFRSTARLAPSPWPIMRDILETNRVNILAGMRQLVERLREMEVLLENGQVEELARTIEEGSQRYEKLVR